ncbi:MAG TPA: formate dehydrogenase accessory protein FdhE [Terriglobales bacterium]|nr:formate dehydrogenase accessory protein FdhE [Terriglobales bacterium]
MKRSKWDQRIERTEELARTYSFAAQILRFYKHVVILQQEFYACLGGANGSRASKRRSHLFDEELDFEFLIPKFPEFLSRIETVSPEPIMQAARSLKAQGSSTRAEILSSHWRHDHHIDPRPESTLVRTFLQPYAEFIADHSDCADHSEAVGVCPFCNGKPAVGVLRPEGDGGKRSLICSLCFTEWKYGRIRCVACGEEAVDKLAVYTAEQFPQVRVEACDTCHRYIKTMDLTKNGLAVPIVDELASLPLNLWAQEHQYVKLQPNILGI